MNKLMMAGVAGAFLAGGAAMAGEPVKLTDGQMDNVTAGWRLAGGLGFTGGAFAGSFGPGFGTAAESSTTLTEDSGSLVYKPGTGGGLTLTSFLGATNTSATETAYAGLGGGFGASKGTFSLAFVASN